MWNYKRGMSSPRDSLPKPLRAQIEAAAFDFATQIVGAFEQSVLDVTERLADTTSEFTTRRGQAKPPSPASPPSGRGLPRRIEKALAKSGGTMSAEALNHKLGTTTADLKAALRQLVDAGRVGKHGKARGTKYFLR